RHTRCLSDWSSDVCTSDLPGAERYVGLRRGVTREEFEEKIRAGTVTECFHCISVNPGDAMFLPSGRVDAIGAGLVLFEIQENSQIGRRSCRERMKNGELVG